MTKRVLIIDDDKSALQLIVGVLTAEGHEPFAFEDFEAAFENARQIPPDLVLTDVVMPKTSGFDVCRMIKKAFQPHPPPVIVMTGKLDAVDPVLARRMGADDFVVKTSDMAVLIQAVRKILTGQKSV